MIYAIIIYIIFILTARGRVLPNLLLFSTLFIIYCINSYTRYLERRNRIKKKTVNKVIVIEKILLIFALLVFIIGLIDYYIYKKELYGNEFNLYKFVLGTTHCKFDGRNDVIEDLKMTKKFKTLDKFLQI